MYGREELVLLLKRRGFLGAPEAERAFRSLDMEAFLPEELRPLAYANAPVPFSMRFRGTTPSPMALAAFVQLLQLTPGLRVAIVGATGGYAAALIAHAADGTRVFVSEVDPATREETARNLKRAGLDDRIAVGADLEGGPFDRVLIVDTAQRPLREITPLLSDMGFAISRIRTPEEKAVRKRIRSGGEDLELSVAEMPLSPGSLGGMRWAQLLTRDELAEHAWEGRVVGFHDAHFCEGIEETFEGGPLDEKGCHESVSCLAARRTFHVAYILQCLGDHADAADLYERSLAFRPSSEAHTFLGWVRSFSGDLEGAIRECERAIGTDPSFGNPYNDIGAYLIELERLDEAVPWLKKALESRRYSCYYYAHTNLGRVYMLKGLTRLAQRHLEEALRLNPDYEPAREMLQKVNRGTDYVA